MSYFKCYLSQVIRSSVCVQSDPNQTPETPKPCMKRKASLFECVKYGISIEKAAAMSPADLTDADLHFLLQQGISRDLINRAYGLGSQPLEKNAVNH